eukprot:TRINITY_DN15857_c0_g1_i1.p1 TRINITY_DN15857_c0_g1~~TRINITY_DN15857_c0_g1_i1.p1  ORF type:complete len:141 (+),score=5.97 TRINITY_DN15857_c0_g1_i1:29-424(+)
MLKGALGCARGLGQQVRCLSSTKPLLWDKRDMPRKVMPAYSVDQRQVVVNHSCESRFRLVGPPWAQVLVHKSHGLNQRWRFDSYAWRAMGRWRRLNPNFSRKYRHNLMPYSVNGTRWSSGTSYNLSQNGIC